MLNVKSLRRIWIRPCLLAAALPIILTSLLSASVMRIDGAFRDWKNVTVCARDPKGDAKGAFDITKVYAASQGCVLYLRFDTNTVLNLQNGPEDEGTLLIKINLPNDRQLVLDTRGRRAFLNDGSKKLITWDRLDYIVGPTYAQDEFEIQVDLGVLGINRGDAISIQFDGSDQLSAPVKFTLSQPLETPTRRSHRREPGTDVRIVSFNTLYEGLSDPDRAESMGRLLNSVNGDVYCFQEEWKTEGHREILNRLMLLEGKRQWHIHKVHGNVIASMQPLNIVPSKNDRYAAAVVKSAGNNLLIINAHLKAMGYIDSPEDRLRVGQASDIVATIGEVHSGQYFKDQTPGTKPAVVIVGDFNLVGSRKPLDLILDKKAYDLKDWLIPNLIGESVFTWRGGSRSAFAPGKLDYVVYSAQTLIPKNGFILNSELLNKAERRQLKLDPTDSALSDHLLMTIDFQFTNPRETVN
jgi:endonuclease/exonuclease/phosphatase family metal-dependent hydrolase